VLGRKELLGKNGEQISPLAGGTPELFGRKTLLVKNGEKIHQVEASMLAGRVACANGRYLGIAREKGGSG
jgi:hypothetical protein